MARNAWVLTGEAFDERNERHTFALKAWRPAGGGRQCLLWEIRRLLPAWGYVERSRATSTCRVVNRLKSGWDALWQHLGLEPRDRCGLSRHSQGARGQRADQLVESEQEYWLDTAGLISLLPWLYERRRSVEARNQVKLFATMFLQLTCEPTYKHEAFLIVPPATLLLCDIGQRGPDGSCACMQVVQHEKAQLSQQRTILQVLAFICVLLGQLQCTACTKHVRDILLAYSQHIDSRPDAWGNSGLIAFQGSELPGDSGKKRKRADPHLREMCAEDPKMGNILFDLAAGDSEGRKRRSTTRTWMSSFMAEHLAMGRLMFPAKPHSIAFVFDAARIGKPAVETLVNMAWVPGKTDAVYILPPAVVSRRLVTNQLIRAASSNELLRRIASVIDIAFGGQSFEGPELVRVGRALRSGNPLEGRSEGCFLGVMFGGSGTERF